MNGAHLIASLTSANGNAHELWLAGSRWTKVTRFADGAVCRVVCDRIGARDFCELAEREGELHEPVKVAS